MNNTKINAKKFRECFNIPSPFVRSVCKILNIDILKDGENQLIPLYNQDLEKENDTIILYAFVESKTTGVLETTKKKDFNEEQINICSLEVKAKRDEYIYIKDEPTTTLSRAPKNAIDISPSNELDLKKEEFINILAEVVSQSVASQNKSVLNTQEELHNAMEKKWLLSNEQLAKLLGMSKSTIGSKPDGWRRMGFQYTKEKEGSMTLWRVSQY